MKSPKDLFLDSLDWLRSSFSNQTFYVERDVVWTLQTYLTKAFRKDYEGYAVFNDFGILPGKRRRLSADLAILDEMGSIVVASEFKYEPSHSRIDIPREKFPVVIWGKDGVAKDIDRIQRFVLEAGVAHAYSIFIDEGGYFRSRDPHPRSRWIHWSGDISVLWSEVHLTNGSQ